LVLFGPALHGCGEGHLKAGDTYQYSGKEESYEKYQYTMDYVYTVYPESVAQWAKDVFASV